MKAWMMFKSLVTAVFGILFVVMPASTLDFFGVGLGEGGVFITRFLGASFILLCVMLWIARNDQKSQALRGIFYGIFVGDVIGFVVALWAQLSGVFNGFGWAIVAIYLILALGFGYSLFREPVLKLQTT